MLTFLLFVCGHADVFGNKITGTIPEEFTQMKVWHEYERQRRLPVFKSNHTVLTVFVFDRLNLVIFGRLYKYYI